MGSERCGMAHYFIAGTSTDVGKTHITVLLLQALRQAGRRAAGYKPVCSGGRGDALLLQAQSQPGLPIEALNPLWFQAPLAPYAASLIENKPVDVAQLLAGFHAVAKELDTVLVEGAGGWETPLAPGKTMADLAQDLELPVLLVVNNKLGAINHTLLTLQAISARGLHCAGLILNYVEEERDAASISNKHLLLELAQVPILAEILHGTEIWDAEWLPE